MQASRMGMRVSLRRRRKIHRSARRPRLTSVKPQAMTSRIQKSCVQISVGAKAWFDNTRIVPAKPVIRTAMADADSSTHASERGDRSLMVADSFPGWCFEGFTDDVGALPASAPGRLRCREERRLLAAAV